MEERRSFSYSYFLLLFIYLSVAQKLCVLLKRFTKKDVKWLMQSWIWLVATFDIHTERDSQWCHFILLTAVISDDEW